MAMTIKSMRTAYVCYSIKTEFHNGLFYVGVCALSVFHDLPDARRNSEWIKHTMPGDAIVVTVLAVCETEDAAKALQSAVATSPAWANTHGTMAVALTPRAVRCVETGEEYDNPTQAAAAIGISRQRMAVILKRQGRTAAGHTFNYVY